MGWKEIKNQILYDYKNSGILIRGNDGQTNVSLTDCAKFAKNFDFSDYTNIQEARVTDSQNSNDPLTLSSIYNTLQKPYLSSPLLTAPKFQTFLPLITNAAPQFSATELSSKANYPIAWYNSTYNEPFKGMNNDKTKSKEFPPFPPETSLCCQREGNALGYRNLFVVIFNNKKIGISAGYIFDGDSNLNVPGVIPPTYNESRINTPSLYSTNLAFNGVKTKVRQSDDGNFTEYRSFFNQQNPNSQNNNNVMNPQFRPENFCDNNKFLTEIATIKGNFIKKLYHTGNNNKAFENMLNLEYNSGAEIEIETYPKKCKSKNVPFGTRKFTADDILAFAIVSDAASKNIFINNVNNWKSWKTDEAGNPVPWDGSCNPGGDYWNKKTNNYIQKLKKAKNDFINAATAKPNPIDGTGGGWIKYGQQLELQKKPLFLINGVALPPVALEGTSDSNSPSIGSAWLEYLNPEPSVTYNYTQSLTTDNIHILDLNHH